MVPMPGNGVPVTNTFDRDGLSARGFLGFLPFHGIDLERIPKEPGVYVVLREKPTRPTFLTENPAGRFKDRNPTVPVGELEAAWPEGSQCVYIGKAGPGRQGDRHLRQRIREFRQYGDGLPVAHQGGRRIWQLADSDRFVLAWRVTLGEEPEIVEGELIRAFVAEFGMRPIGNRTNGRQR